MPDIRERLESVRDAIAAHAREFGRDPAEIRLVAVAKTRPPADVANALDADQRDFGENYLDEALDKIESLDGCGARWHFIGRIQSNKTRELAARFDWVQTVDRLKIARRLAEQRPEGLPPLNICLQVNVDADPGKGGIEPGDAEELAERVAALPQLRLRGLMTIPAPETDFERQRAAFSRLRECFEQLQRQHDGLDTLSMGMSGDLRAAIAEGSTMVRVGTAIFGRRA